MKIKELKNSNLLLIKVFDNDECNVVCDYALIPITVELLEQINGMRKSLLDAKAKNSSIFELTAFEYATDWVSGDTALADKATSDDLLYEMGELVDKTGLVSVAIENKETLEENNELCYVRVDVPVMHVTDYGIRFTAYVKHTDIHLETESISFDTLNSISF